jgi:hypothetical protein
MNMGTEQGWYAFCGFSITVHFDTIGTKQHVLMHTCVCDVITVNSKEEWRLLGCYAMWLL